MFTSRRPHVPSKRMQCNPAEAQEHPFLEVLSPLCWSLTGVGSRLLVSTCSRWWPSAFSNLMLPAGRLDMDHLSSSRSCSPLLIVPVLCDLVAKALCRMSIVSGAPGVITVLGALWRQPRRVCSGIGPLQQYRCSPLCKRGAALQPRRLLGSRRNIIASHTCFIPLVTPQPLCEPSVTSPPCLFRNYLLFWGEPTLRPVAGLWAQGREQKKGAGEKEISVHLKKERSGLRVGDLPSMMGILLPSLLQRKRGLRGICRKVKRPYRFWSRGETGSCHSGAELGSIVRKATFRVSFLDSESI